MNDYQFLLARLDAFIRKYYLNRLLRGLLLLLIGLVAYVLAVSISEYYIYWPSWVRYSLLSVFIAGGAVAFIYFMVVPLLQMSRLTKGLSHRQAANIIGTHFPNVQDKLLNILQLHDDSRKEQSKELVEASINQKVAQLSVVPLTRAINLSKNKKYLPYLLPLLLVGVFILVAAPNIFKDATDRLLQPGKSFAPPPPFKFYVANKDWVAVHHGDYSVKAYVQGSKLPNELFVVVGEETIAMKPLGKDTFSYTFKNVTQPIYFKLYGAGFYSQSYKITVAQKPVLSAFKVQLTYPAYTGRKSELRNSISDFTVPAGTKVQWALMADHTDKATLTFANGSPINMIRAGKAFAFSYPFTRDTSYTITLTNTASTLQEQMNYKVSIIPDQSPTLQVQEYRDTLSGRYVIITGTAGDDYGISSVIFQYHIANEQGHVLRNGRQALSKGGGPVALFQHQLDINSLGLLPGQKVNYYVEACDNDAINGHKCVRSQVYSFAMYKYQQIDSIMLDNAQQISSGISNSAQQTQQLTEEFMEMQSKMLDGQAMDWETENALQQLSQKQESLKAQLEKAKQKLDEQMKQAQQKQASEDIKEKQEELKKQMDNLLNKELQDMIKKLQEILAKKNKENNMQQLQQLEMQNKLFNMDLERLNELVKKLELQMRLEDAAAKAEKMATEQQGIKLNTEQESKSQEQLTKDQKDLEQKLDDFLKQDLKEMEELAKQMQQQQDMSKMEEKGGEAKQEMQKSSNELSKKNNSKASQSQNKAAQNLQQMAQMMQQAAGGMDMQQIDIDIKATRQLLTNLIRLSFDQEKLMNLVGKTSISNKAYLDNMHEQKRLHANSKMIRDSLFALSKRVFKLAANVNKETAQLEANMRLSLNALEARNTADARTRQQYVMTHTNNLALMLNELLSNLMQMQAEGMKGGTGSCNNPGGSKPGKKPGQGMSMQLSDIITRQQQLGQGMGQGQGQGQNGQQPNGKDNGNASGQQGNKQGEGGQGEYGNSEQLARTAAQQAAIRKQLQELSNMLNSKGMGDIAKELRDVQQQMDKNETDLVNKRLTGDLLLRQQDILTRLLKAEKSVREQEQDDKRSSRSAEEVARQIPAELQRILLERQKMIEVYKTIPPQLKPYYKEMVERYYKSIAN